MRILGPFERHSEEIQLVENIKAPALIEKWTLELDQKEGEHRMDSVAHEGGGDYT
jgi:hypothetical protein